MDRTASWAQIFVDQFRAFGVEFLNYLPDYVGDQIVQIAEREGSFQIVRLAREEEGVGLVAGQHLGGRRGALIVPTAGIGNSINAIASLGVPYAIPLPMIIGRRGGLGEINPTQTTLGRALPKILESMGILTIEIESADDLQSRVYGGLQSAFRCEEPVAFLVSFQLAGWKQ